MKKILLPLLAIATLACSDEITGPDRTPSVLYITVAQPGAVTQPTQLTITVSDVDAWSNLPPGSMTVHVTAPGPTGPETKLITESTRLLDSSNRTVIDFVFSADRDPTVVLVHLSPKNGKTVEARCTPTTDEIWHCR